MVSAVEIIDGIRAVVKSTFPDVTQYINLCPEKFERPSILTEYVTSHMENENFFCVRMAYFFTLTIQDQLDHRSHTDTKRLLFMQEKLLRQFSSGVLQAGDRFLPLKACSSGRDWDKAYIDVQLEFLDDREMEKENNLMMEEIEIKMKHGGDSHRTAKY